jgi:hypothetical protein
MASKRIHRLQSNALILYGRGETPDSIRCLFSIAQQELVLADICPRQSVDCSTAGGFQSIGQNVPYRLNTRLL